jgi:hypothetical protein
MLRSNRNRIPDLCCSVIVMTLFFQDYTEAKSIHRGKLKTKIARSLLYEHKSQNQPISPTPNAKPL